MIPSANGTRAVFHELAKYLSSKFKVVCWDRRGYSQSLLSGEQDFTDRLSVDADDAFALIQYLSDDPAFVFGTSSRAIVATQLLVRHPKIVRAIVSHEPPAFALLPEEHQGEASGLIEHIYNLYRTKGVHTAIETFSAGLFPIGEEGERCFEPKQYTSAILDVDTIVVEKEKYTPAAGIVSADGPGAEPIALLAGMVEKEAVRLPRGHVLYILEPEAFSTALSDLLV